MFVLATARLSRCSRPRTAPHPLPARSLDTAPAHTYGHGSVGEQDFILPRSSAYVEPEPAPSAQGLKLAAAGIMSSVETIELVYSNLEPAKCGRDTHGCNTHRVAICLPRLRYMCTPSMLSAAPTRRSPGDSGRRSSPRSAAGFARPPAAPRYTSIQG